MEMNPADGQFLGMVGVNVWSFMNASALFSICRLDRRYRWRGHHRPDGAVFPPALLSVDHRSARSCTVSLGTSRWRYVAGQIAAVRGWYCHRSYDRWAIFGLSESVLLFILGVSIPSLSWREARAVRSGKGTLRPRRLRGHFSGRVHQRHWYAARGIYRPCRPDRRNHIAMVGMLMSIGYRAIAFGLLGVSFGSYVLLIATMIVMSFLGTWSVNTRWTNSNACSVPISVC